MVSMYQGNPKGNPRMFLAVNPYVQLESRVEGRLIFSSSWFQFRRYAYLTAPLFFDRG